MTPPASNAKFRLVGLQVLTWIILPVVFTVHANAALIAAWGNNTFGQCQVPAGITNAVGVSAGSYHSLALRSDGTVVAWGLNIQGATSVPAGATNAIAIAAGGSFSMALRADGSVIVWGNTNLTNVNLTNITAIAAGATFGVALRQDGTVACWGIGSLAPALTNPPTTATNLSKIFAGPTCVFGVRGDGSVLAWGYDYSGVLNLPPELTGPIKIVCNGLQAAALLGDGRVLTWGNVVRDASTNLWVPTPQCGVVDVAVFGLTNLMVGVDGRLYAWSGWDTNAPLEPQLVQPCLSNITAVAASSHVLALVGWGPPLIESIPEAVSVEPGTEAQITAVVAGCQPLTYQWFKAGVKLTNTARITGVTTSNLVISGIGPADVAQYTLEASNAYGSVQSGPVRLLLTNCAPMFQALPKGGTGLLGNSFSLTSSVVGPEPIQLQWKFNGADIPGATHSTFRIPMLRYTNAGYYSLNARNAFGQTNSAKVFLTIAEVGYVGMVLASTGEVAIAFVPCTTASNLVQISVNLNHSLGLTADGSVTVWPHPAVLRARPGLYYPRFFPPTNPPPPLRNIVRVAAGPDFNVAVDSAGRVFLWGEPRLARSGSYLYPTNVPPSATNIVDVAAGYYSVLALGTDGRVLKWDPNSTGTLDFVPAGISNALGISSFGLTASSADVAAALTAEGRLTVWSNNIIVTNLVGLNEAIDVELIWPICLVLMKDNRIRAIPLATDSWVRLACSNLNQLAVLTNVVAVSGLVSERSVWESILKLIYYEIIALHADGKATRVLFSSTNTTPALAALSVSNLLACEHTELYPVVLASDGLPCFRIQPRNLILGAGMPAEFHARAVSPGQKSYQWYFNNRVIPGATNADFSIPAISGKHTGMYHAVVQTAYGSATSSVATLTVITECTGELAAALNTPTLNWQTSTNAPWFAQNIEARDLNCAAQSGLITHNQSSALWTTAEGPGTISFWWRVSSEEWFDTLRFELNGTNMASISGEVDWQMRSYRMGPGLHTLRWTYAKDATVSAGADAAWLDQVTYQPDPPVVSVTPTYYRARAGMSATFQGQVVGASPLSYQWYKGDVPKPGATNNVLALVNLTAEDTGQYTLKVLNPGGIGTSPPVTLIVIGKARFFELGFTDTGEFVAFAADETRLGYMPDDIAELRVQVSTNLINWDTLPIQLTFTNGTIRLCDTVTTNYPTRFYRLIQQ